MSTPEEWHAAIKKVADMAREDERRKREIPVIDRVAIKAQLTKTLESDEREGERWAQERERLAIEARALQDVYYEKRAALEETEKALAEASAPLGRNGNEMERATRCWRTASVDKSKTEQNLRDLERGLYIPEGQRGSGKARDFNSGVMVTPAPAGEYHG